MMLVGGRRIGGFSGEKCILPFTLCKGVYRQLYCRQKVKGLRLEDKGKTRINFSSL
jgi:hypothetical protein